MKNETKTTGLGSSLTSEEVNRLVARVADGDEEAARDLMEYLFPFVSKIVNARLRYRESKEDVTQEIFMRVFTKLGQYSGKVPFHHWVSRIAVNTCTTAYHRSKANREFRLADLSEEEARVVESVKSAADEIEPSDHLAARELVEKLLDTLNSDDRLVIRLVYLNGFSHQQVSDVTGWSVSLAKVRAFRARQRLRRSLDRLNSAPVPTAPPLEVLKGLVSSPISSAA